MPANLAWIVNPRRRRRAKKSRARRHGRSAAQRAATARMLAANRSRRGGRARSYAVNPRRRRAKSYRRNPSRSLRRSFSASMPGAIGMVKTAAIAGGGAVLVDVGMGYLGRVLPAAASPVNADGTTNWLYFSAKAGLAVGLGTYGRRILPPAIASNMGAGALAVMSYQILRGLVPSGVALGYLNPAPVTRSLSGSGRGGQSLARYLSGNAQGGSSLGAYESTSGEAGAIRAANVVRMRR